MTLQRSWCVSDILSSPSFSFYTDLSLHPPTLEHGIYAILLQIVKLAVKICHSADNELPLSISFHTRESCLGATNIVVIGIHHHVHIFPIVSWVFSCQPARVWASPTVAATIKLPLPVQYRWEILTLESCHQTII